MRIRPYDKTFTLEAEHIDAFSDALEESLASIQTERQNRIRIRLSMEEALLRMRDHFGEQTVVTAVIDRRLRRPYIQIELEGDPFNPLSRAESDQEDWNSSLLTAVGLSPRYSYTGKVNLLKLTFPVQSINPVIKLVLALMNYSEFGEVPTFSGELRMAFIVLKKDMVERRHF